MFSIDSQAAWLIAGGHYRTQPQGKKCVCLGLRQWTQSVRKENNTINHCSWTLLSKIMNRIDNLSENAAILFIALVMAAEEEGAIDLHPPPYCFDCCYQKLNNRGSQNSLKIFFF